MLQSDYPKGNLIVTRGKYLELIYASEEIKLQCTSVKAAKKLFGGDAVQKSFGTNKCV